MAFFTANQKIADHPFTPREIIREEVWGEIWRAKYKDGRPVIVVAYATPEGDALFEEAEPFLEKWKTVSEGTVAPQLLRILEISRGAIPYIIVEDPGGRTLRELVMAQSERLPLETQGAFGLCMAHALTHAESYNIAPAGLTPDTIFQNPRDRDVSFQLLPIAPGTRLQAEYLCAGRYFPPAAKDAPQPAKLHPDSYSLAWLWSDVYRRDFESVFMNPREAIPYKGLCFVLEMCLEMQKGAYSEPATVMVGVDRWVRRTMQEDVEAEQEQVRVKKRGAFGNFLYNNRTAFKNAGIAVLVIGLLGGIAAGIYFSGLFKAPRSVFIPEDVANTFLDSLITGDVEKAREVVFNPGDDQTDDMLAMIEEMESKGTIERWSRYSNVISGGGTHRVIDVTLYDADKTPFGIARIRLTERNDAHWFVETVFFRPTKFS